MLLPSILGIAPTPLYALNIMCHFNNFAQKYLHHSHKQGHISCSTRWHNMHQ
jgi:hypothetical protein